MPVHCMEQGIVSDGEWSGPPDTVYVDGDERLPSSTFSSNFSASVQFV